MGGDDSEALYRARKRTRTTMSDIAVQVAHNVAKSARRDTLHALECGNERGGNNVAKAAEMDKERAEQTAGL